MPSLKMLKFIKNPFKKLDFSKIDKDRFLDIKDLLLNIGIYGFAINFMLWVIWNVPLNYYSWIAYGVLFYLIDEKLVRGIRRIKAK